MEMLHGVWKQHLRPRAVVGYGVKIFLPSPPNYVTRSPGQESECTNLTLFPKQPSYLPPFVCQRILRTGMYKKNIVDWDTLLGMSRN